MLQITPKRRGEYLQAVLRILVEKGGSLSAREAIREAEVRLELSDYEKEPTPKNKNPRWWAILQLYSIDLVKAGWLQKNNAVWYITEGGREALKLPSEEFIRKAMRAYSEWKKTVEPEESAKEEGSDEVVEPLAYEEALATAQEEIKTFILTLNPYEFQKLVAALFRGMGYSTPFIASPGPDAGIDIVAYKDPIGAGVPRIRVQIKHQSGPVGRPDVQKLLGVLQGDGYVGVLVSSGGFSKEAVSEIRTARHHIEKIDLDRFVELWNQHYDNMSESDRALLPIRKIAFRAPEE